MENPYASYYTTQAGNGITEFTGSRVQRGHGFFGRVFSGILIVLKYLGRQALTTGVNVAQDALKADNFKDTLKTSLKRSAADTIGNIASDFSSRAKRYAQTGEGYRRKRRKTRKQQPKPLIKKKSGRKRRIKRPKKTSIF